MRIFQRIHYLLLVLVFFPFLGTNLFAQTPKKILTAPATLKNLQNTILSNRLEHALGTQWMRRISPPPLILKTVTRQGQSVLIAPKHMLNQQLHYFNQQQVPIERVYRYIKDLQNQVDNRESFYELLFKAYYNDHFHVFTPNLEQFVQKIISLHDVSLEQRIISRMKQLIQYKPQLATKFPILNPEYSIRMRYIEDIETLTVENFTEEALLLSIEQPLLASTKKTFIRHIKGNSTFKVGKQQQEFRVHNYKGPAQYLPNLYRYLVNGDDTKMPMYLAIDQKQKSLLLFNYDFTTWLRITPHEYSRPGNLHVHVYKKFQEDLVVDGIRKMEPVLINLSIPIKNPDHVHSMSPEDLYNLFIKNPMKELRANPYVKTAIR